MPDRVSRLALASTHNVKAPILLGAAAATSYPAYADDFTSSVQDVVDAWTDLRNDNLAERFFGGSCLTPRMAAVGTVESAIDLYDTQGGDAAFADINAMMADADYPPFIDRGFYCELG